MVHFSFQCVLNMGHDCVWRSWYFIRANKLLHDCIYWTSFFFFLRARLYLITQLLWRGGGLLAIGKTRSSFLCLTKNTDHNIDGRLPIKLSSLFVSYIKPRFLLIIKFEKPSWWLLTSYLFVIYSSCHRPSQICGGWLTSLIHQIRKDFHSWTGFCSKSIHPSNDCIDLVILALNFICIKLRPLMHLLIVFRYILKCRSRQVMEDVNSSMNRFSIKEGIVNCRTCPIIYLLVLLSTKLEDSWSRDNVIHSITGDFHIRVKGNVDAMSCTIQITQKVTK